MADDGEADILKLLGGKGINPRDILSTEDWSTKGSITIKQALAFAMSAAARKSSPIIYLEGPKRGQFVNGPAEILIKELMIYSRSVNGMALEKFVQVSSNRVKAQDMQTKLNVHKEEDQ